jgi:hypothetical protein
MISHSKEAVELASKMGAGPSMSKVLTLERNLPKNDHNFNTVYKSDPPILTTRLLDNVNN